MTPSSSPARPFAVNIPSPPILYPNVSLCSLVAVHLCLLLPLLLLLLLLLQGYVDATPEHPLEAASAAAFAAATAGGGASLDHDHDSNGENSRQVPPGNSRTFVTQENTAAVKAAASRSSLEELSERDIGGSGGGRGGGDDGSGSVLAPGGGNSTSRSLSPRCESQASLLSGVSHQPQAPLI